MNRYNWYYRQKVTEAEMDGLQANIEQAISNAIKDVYRPGWISGANLQPSSGMTVQVTAGTGYNDSGERIYFGTAQSINMSGYRPTTSGREAWCLVAARFKRVLSDPRTDGHGNTVYFREDEGFEIVVRKGTEAATGSATKPAAQAGDLIIGYVRVYYGQSSVAAGDISTAEKPVMKGPGDVQADLEAHMARKDNPHGVKADQVPITDSGGHFNATNVEAALAEEAAARKAHANATSVHGATSAATANRLIIRDSNGRAKVAAPSASDDIARKAEVDNHANATSVHGATSAATANRIIIRDANGRAKVAAPSASDDIARKAEVDAVQSNLDKHVGSGGSAHAEATTSTAGFMSAADKAKLNGIAAGAEVNQNAFTNIQIQNSSGSAKATHAADSKQDTYALREGGAIVITAPADDVAQIAHADTSSQASVNNSDANVIQGVTLDGYGHVTALKSVQITPALIGAAASSHEHSAADITSGTMAAARLPSASTSAAGIVQLTTSRTSSSSTLALTASAMNSHRTSGDHDGRYYQKSEVDSKIASAGVQWYVPSDSLLVATQDFLSMVVQEGHSRIVHRWVLTSPGRYRVKGTIGPQNYMTSERVELYLGYRGILVSPRLKYTSIRYYDRDKWPVTFVIDMDVPLGIGDVLEFHMGLPEDDNDTFDSAYIDLKSVGLYGSVGQKPAWANYTIPRLPAMPILGYVYDEEGGGNVPVYQFPTSTTW